MVGETASLVSSSDTICRRLCDLCERGSVDLRQIENVFQCMKRELLDSALLQKSLNLRMNLGNVAALIDNVSSLLDVITACNRTLTAARSCAWCVRGACDCVLVVVQTLQLLYQLCKDTQSSPGEALVELSSKLATVFRQGFALQSTALGLLEEACRDGVEDASRASISALCDRLCGLADLVQCLDPKALVSIWRLVSRLFAASSSCPAEDLPLLLSTLCSNVDAQVRLTLGQAAGPGFDNGLKLAAFLAKVLLNLLGAVNLEKGNAGTLLQFLLRLHTHMLGAHVLTERQQTEVSSRLFFMADLLLDTAICESAFVTAVLDMPQDRYPEAQVCLLSRVLLQFHRLDQAPDAAKAWLRGPASIFRRLFTLLPSCVHELRLRRTVFNCGFVRAPDLYTFVLLGVCAGASCLSQDDFPDLESLLFSVLLFSSSRECRQLAEDCLTFLARFASNDLCRAHALLAATAAQAATPSAARRWRRLVARLWPVVSERTQVELLTTFPLRQRRQLWRCLPARRLTKSARDEAERQVLEEGSRLLRQDNNRKDETASFLLTAAHLSPSPRLSAWLHEERTALVTMMGNFSPGSSLHTAACRLMTEMVTATARLDPVLLQACFTLADSDHLSSLSLVAAVSHRGGAPLSLLRRLLAFLLSPCPLAAVAAVSACSRLARSGADDRILDELSRHQARSRFEGLVAIQGPLSTDEVSTLTRTARAGEEEGSPACKRPRSTAEDSDDEEAIDALEAAISQLERSFHRRPLSVPGRERVCDLHRRLTALTDTG